MNKKLFFPLIILVFSFTLNAQAACVVTVGGPGAKMQALESLSASLTKMFKTKKLNEVEVLTVASLGEAIRLEADYMVYLTGDASYVRMQFRDILINRVIIEKKYSSSFGLNPVISKITKDIEKEIVSQLPDYCRE